jgi:hypothetical protein
MCTAPNSEGRTFTSLSVKAKESRLSLTIALILFVSRFAPPSKMGVKYLLTPFAMTTISWRLADFVWSP